MNITVIIPVHKFDEEIAGLLDKAITSVENQKDITEKPKTLIISPNDISEDIYNKFKDRIVTFCILGIDENTNYQSMVNNAIQYVESDYFSVLEFDDEYSAAFFKNAEKYIKAYSNVDIFLPIMIEVNAANEGIKLTNETVWAQNFVGENGEMGYLNINSLKQYTDFKLSGAIIKKSEFINIGKYKTKIEITFGYELLLRALNNACKIYTIPKIGYKHFATRIGSMFDVYSKITSPEERKFWFDTAIKEAMFVSDRDINITKIKK
jgi:hypothetical protein